MSGIDYRALREAVSMERVLRLLDYEPSSRRGEQLRGTCPLHDPAATGDRRCFPVHLGRNLFRCFRCGAAGNQLDLWRLVHRLPLHDAARKLRHAADVPPPHTTGSIKPQAEIRNPPPPPSRPATA